MQGTITTLSIINPLKGRKSSMFGNNPKKSKFHSWVNYEQTQDGECLFSFGAESFVFEVAHQKYKE
jgi:hypothetical protein